MEGDPNAWAGEFKKQLVLGFKENGIERSEQVQRMMAAARKDVNPFMPSVGQLVAWAKTAPPPYHQAFDARSEHMQQAAKQLASQCSSRQRARQEFKELRRILREGKGSGRYRGGLPGKLRADLQRPVVNWQDEAEPAQRATHASRGDFLGEGDEV